MKTKCCVCHTKVDEKAKTTCNHYLCGECVSKICTTACPMCRCDPIRNGYITDDILQNIRERGESQVRSILSEFPPGYLNNLEDDEDSEADDPEDKLRRYFQDQGMSPRDIEIQIELDRRGLLQFN